VIFGWGRRRRPLVAHAAPGAGGQLPAGRFRPVERLRDFGERPVEDVVQ